MKCYLCEKTIKDGMCLSIWDSRKGRLALVFCPECNENRSDEVKKIMDEKIWKKPPERGTKTVSGADKPTKAFPSSATSKNATK